MIKRIVNICIIIMTTFNVMMSQKNKETMVLIETSKGNIKIKLYNETFKHRENFIKLVNEKYYDGVLFHRVIKNFMVQTGDPNSKNAPEGKMLGNGGPGYTIPAEFNKAFIHKKGALAAARTGDNINPAKASSGSQFYIVQGKKATDEELNNIEQNINSSKEVDRIREFIMRPENKQYKDLIIKYQNEHNTAKLEELQLEITKIVEQKLKNEPLFKYSIQQRDIYKKIGGTPFLDMNYTVFGEVVEGLDVVDKIAEVRTTQGDRPAEDVKIILMKVLK